MPPLFHRAVIVGVGQLGASIGMNLVSKKIAREVIGVGLSRCNLQKALKRKALNRSGSFRDLLGLESGDLIILAAPVRTIRASLKTLPKGPLIIDVGSTKTSIVREARRRRLRFIGCHPIAGTEKGGATSGDSKLFRGRTVILTPGRSVRPSDLRLVTDLWKKLGAKTDRLAPEEHDRVFAVTSHLPHALAFGLSRVAGQKLQAARHAPFVFASFRDATRVAESPVDMWRDIFLENAPEVLKVLDA